jgi:hypothetical protein
MQYAWSFYPAAVCAATVLYFFLPTGAQSALYDLVGVSAAVAILASAWRRRPDHEAAWFLVGLGVLSLSIGDVIFGVVQGTPSIADVMYISGYSLLALGLLGMAPVWVRHLEANPGAGLAVAAIIAVVAWVFLVLPTGQESVSVTSRVVAVGYPLMDFALIGLLIRAAVPHRLRDATLLFVGLGLVFLLGADIVYATESFGSTYAPGFAVDALWLLAYGSFGTALLVPAASRYAAVSHAETHTETSMGGAFLDALTHEVRFGYVVSITGRVLVGFAALAIMAGTAWAAVDMILLAAAYGFTGGLMWVATSGSRSSYRTVYLGAHA